MKAADIAIFNASLMSMDAHQPCATAVALRGDEIVAVGNDERILAIADSRTRRIDAQGRTVLPGFIESHLHLFVGAGELGHL